MSLNNGEKKDGYGLRDRERLRRVEVLCEIIIWMMSTDSKVRSWAELKELVDFYSKKEAGI